jgi:ethanolamine permease
LYGAAQVTGSASEAATLKRGSAGWLTLAGLGVAYVIAGEFAAWNYGLAFAGTAGLLVATGIAAVMYYVLSDCLAELATVLPTAGGGYAFARIAFGPAIGFVVGAAILLEYICAAGAIGVFATSYLRPLFGLVDGSHDWLLLLGIYGLFGGLQLLGVTETLKLTLLFAIVAAAGLVIAVIALANHVEWPRYFDIPTMLGGATGKALPFGWVGIWGALPFGAAAFLAVEGVPLAAEEARDPVRDVPIGIRLALLVLIVLAFSLMIVLPGAAGALGLSKAGDPILYAIEHVYGPERMAVLKHLVNVTAVIGLLASFHSSMYAFSRLAFSLARAGYLPLRLATLNRRGAPHWAVLLPGLVALALSLTGSADQLVVILVFAGTLSYVFLIGSHIHLRQRHPELPRHYRNVGGIAAAWLGVLLAASTFLACFLANIRWSFVGVAMMAAATAYYALVSRSKLSATSPEALFENRLRAGARVG